MSASLSLNAPHLKPHPLLTGHGITQVADYLHNTCLLHHGQTFLTAHEQNSSPSVCNVVLLHCNISFTFGCSGLHSFMETSTHLWFGFILQVQDEKRENRKNTMTFVNTVYAYTAFLLVLFCFYSNDS